MVYLMVSWTKSSVEGLMTGLMESLITTLKPSLIVGLMVALTANPTEVSKADSKGGLMASLTTDLMAGWMAP